ncbi:amino acid ABC transporter membrane protein 1 (PAAT family) [Murinocardiopsis flavida]|uniref:Amino acid ABC transporter membrane protein 1 (PAAT family) n=1 Tax=Murinocardiopsis flavida TaxID=645275 RepID=A0A2P8DMW9_9ACTN|nr:ectoine/hydroxyectoine ABC transporter permease subunit EhuC [Murinocardiopsis flavida]PSK98563.1 amino acid ABC transporter membrane protein 1 (PAAT family) [Murinocardiopsis flavida]
MDFITDSLPLYINGALYTLLITVGGCALAFVIAMSVGILGTLRSRVARAVASIYVEVFRGVAALVLMFWMFYAMPLVTGYLLDPVFAAILALGLNVGAYGAENVRGAIKAVPAAQYEATIALNFTPAQRLRSVILPQAWAQMLPTFGNLIIELMKGSAVVSLIAVSDLTFVGDQVRAFTGQTLAAYTAALVMYFLLAQVFLYFMRMAERSANRRLGREPLKAKKSTPAVAGAGGAA